MWISWWKRAHVFDSASRGSLYPPHECQNLSFLLNPTFFQGVKCQFVGLEASAHLYTVVLKSRCNHVEEFPVFKLCFEMFKRKQRAELHWEVLRVGKLPSYRGSRALLPDQESARYKCPQRGSRRKKGQRVMFHSGYRHQEKPLGV